jgi:glutamate-ammonia-ligase adenylyltransferase
LAPWRAAVRGAADPARARQGLEHLAETPAGTELRKVSPELARLLCALFSGSPASMALLEAHPEWLTTCLQPKALAHPRREEGLRREVNAWLRPALGARDYTGALGRLREFKQREMVRLAARDLGRLSDLPQTMAEISAVGDVCLGSVLQICQEQLIERFGRPFHLDPDERWQPTEFAVIGLGKLGGEELNYSSDVDVVFVYTEEGQVFKGTPGPAAAGQPMSSHQFYRRLAEAFIAELTRTAAPGMLYRIDLRLRPEGDTGPLVRSLGSYENFYAQWGQTWERMMLIKARGVAGDPGLAAEFIEMVQPFRYPRSLSSTFLREVAAMKERIENEVVKAGEIDRNVKLGRGGIREIEFVVQAFQVLHGGRLPFVQGAQTLPALEKLAQYHLIERAEAEDLRAAYCFLRDIEHRLQMENYLQTHTIPADPQARARLAALMGFDQPAGFEAALRDHTRRVRQAYDRFLKPEQPESQHEFPGQFAGAETTWKKILAEHSFQDVEKSFRMLNEFANGPGYVHVSPRTLELAMQLVPKLLALCPQAAPGQPPPGQARVLSDPDRVLTRLDSYISAYGARATMFETWAANPALFELLLLLFDRSEFLAERAIRTPDLVDDLVLSGRLGRRKSAEEILRDLRYGRDDADQRLWLRQYHQAEQMRLGLREILGLADFEQNLEELSALAEACLQYTLEVLLRKYRLKTSPLVILGLGKLGGREINYGSDLDLAFVASPAAKDLPKLQRLAAELMDILSQPTAQGAVFATDARLRPDGEKGLLVNHLSAYEEYYRRRAQLWEIQALSRARPVAGDMALGAEFQRLVAGLADFTPSHVKDNFPLPPPVAPAEAKTPARQSRARVGAATGLAAYTPDWKQQIARMRQRIAKERTPAGQEALAIKTGAGGLMDAEFIAQTLCLEHGWHEPNTLRALARARDTGALAAADADLLIASFRQILRVECILRRWSFVGETVLPDHPAPLYRVAVRCGYPNADPFMDALAAARRAIRGVYEKVL